MRRLALRKGRAREGAFSVEGEDLVATGVHAGWMPRFVLVDQEKPPAGDLLDRLSGCEVLLVPGELMADVAVLAHPPRAIAVFDLPDRTSPSPVAQGGEVRGATVYLDGVRDPGNVGMVLRSASALSATQVALAPNSADPYGPKATRASMGAVFEVATFACSGIGDVAGPGQQVVALDASAVTPLHEVCFEQAPVICIGSERSGLSQDVLERADVLASIPQRVGVDSLNAAAAATVVLYEIARQRLVSAGGAGAQHPSG